VTEPADPRVAEAVGRLDELADKEPADHVEVYEDVHRVLQESLSHAAQEAQEAQETDRPGGDARP
jgi:hypothetical protein